MAELEDTEHDLVQLKAMLDNALDTFMAIAKEALAANPGKEPLAVLFEKIWEKSDHQPHTLTLIICHLLTRLMTAEEKTP